MTNESHWDLTRSSQEKLTKYSSNLIKLGLNLSRQISLNYDSEIDDLLSKGVINYESEKFSIAIDYFNKILDKKKDCFISLFLRGFSYSLLGNQKSSYEDLYLALRIKTNHDDSILALYSKAIVLAQSQAQESINRCYHNLLKIEPDYSKPYAAIEVFIQGVVFYLLGDNQNSLEKLIKAIKISPNFISALVIKGEIYNKLGDYQNSINDLTLAINLNLNHIKSEHAFFLRGYAYLNISDYTSAIRDFDQAIQLNPLLSDAFYNMGLSYYHLGNIEQALENYNQSLKINPNHELAYLNRGVLYSKLGNYQQCINDYTQVLNIKPTFVIAYVNRSRVRAEVGDIQGAIEDATKAIALDSDYADAFYIRAIARRSYGDYQGSIEDLEKFKELSVNLT